MKFIENPGWEEEVSPSLLSFLTKEFSDLTPQELESLQKISQIEQQAKDITRTIEQNLSHLHSYAISTIDSKIDGLGLSPQEKELAKLLYKETLVDPMGEAINRLKTPNSLYSAILSETAADMLEGVLNFKKDCEKKFPATTALVQTLMPIATTLVAAYCPPVKLALAISPKLVSQATTLLGNDNLEKTLEKMRHDLAEIKKDKELCLAYETGERMEELSTQTKISPTALGKLGLHLQDVLHATAETATNIVAERMLRSVCDYADCHLPANLEQIDATFEKLQAATQENLEKLGIPIAEIEASKVVFKDAIIDAKKEMTEVLDPNSKIFDKMAAMQRSSEIIDKAAEQIGATVAQSIPNSVEVKRAVTLSIKKEVQKTIRGEVTEIAKQLNDRSSAKDFAKKALGSNLANEMTLKRAAQTQQIERGV